MTITKLTVDLLRQQAREAAEQHIPHAEANHHEHGSKLWHQFFEAYRIRRAQLHFDAVPQRTLVAVLHRRHDIRTTA